MTNRICVYACYSCNPMEFFSQQELANHAAQTGRSYVRLTLANSGEDKTVIGSMLIELFTDICPRTCDHFLKGVTGKFPNGYSYKNSPIHRVVKHAYIQGGDVVDGTGKGQAGFTIPDETFAAKHDDVGCVALANDGEPHTASTQFYITLKPLPWLDGKRVVFGKIVDKEGLELLRKVEALPLNNERPLPEVAISQLEVAA